MGTSVPIRADTLLVTELVIRQMQILNRSYRRSAVWTDRLLLLTTQLTRTKADFANRIGHYTSLEAIQVLFKLLNLDSEERDLD